jgi:hypothetical protein
MPSAEQNEIVEPNERAKRVASHHEKASAKRARLQHMRERNENYLAERREETAAEDELTEELRVSVPD